MRHFRRTALAAAAAQSALLCSGFALMHTAAAQQPPAAKEEPKTEAADKASTVIVTGRRAALQSAQKIKQESDEIVDSIVAEEMGKLPDRSVTEVLQRVVGVTIDRTMTRNDPEHYSVEGSGVNIRGLSYVRSELNGRDTFSANGGRAINFEDVPPELMAGVDVYKNPSAVQTEGAIGGLVNLRTAMPFDFAGRRGALSLETTYSVLPGKYTPGVSGMFSNRWKTDAGEFGALISLAHSESKTRTDAFQVEPYYKIDPDGEGTEYGANYWVPKGAQWRTLEFQRKRDGLFGALQWKNDRAESSLTYFKSKYKMNWNENALFAQSDPWNIAVDSGARYDANNVLQVGTLREATARDGGINFGADTRYSNRDSSTQELAWNAKWKASDRWTFSTDLQLIRSKTESFDSTVATGVIMPKETLDLSGSIPRIVFDDSDLASLADPSKYYWAFTMEHFDKSKANSKAWRGDAKYKFEDPVLMDLQFGLRLTDRDAVTTNSVPSYNWAGITQTWMKGWYLDDLATLNDPRFSANTFVYPFNNFFGGSVAVPPLIFPQASLASGYPASYAALHQYAKDLCEQKNGAGSGSCFDWWTPATFGTDPAGTNDQHERTQAAYSQLRFGFDDWKYPVDGNLGLRVVRTKMEAHGFTSLTVNLPQLGESESLGGAPIPNLVTFAEPFDFSQTYTNVLPSLNLRMKAASNLQFRVGWAQAIARPDFTQLQAYTTLDLSTKQHTDGTTVIVDSISLTGNGSGNPALKPTKSNQFDATAEWYFSRNGSLTLALFNKQLTDVIVNQTSTYRVGDANNAFDFTVTSPVNGANGHARGFELAFQRYFDTLPGWLSGFGVQANYTFVDSKTKLKSPVYSATCSGTTNDATNLNLNINGCDTDGRTFGDLPLANLSRNAYNLALLYDRGPLSARIAYSWRSKYLQAVNVNGTQGTDGHDADGNSVAWGLPVWNGDYGQLDAGISYRFTDDLSLSLEGQNLTSAKNRQLMQQHIGLMTRAVFYTGPRYTMRMSYTF